MQGWELLAHTPLNFKCQGSLVVILAKDSSWSLVNLTSSNKIEERDCCFAYWFIFLLSHIFFSSAVLIKGQTWLIPLRDYSSPSFTHTRSLFHSLILFFFFLFPPALTCVWQVEDAVFVFSIEENFSLSSPESPCGCAQQDSMALDIQIDLCKAG